MSRTSIAVRPVEACDLDAIVRIDEKLGGQARKEYWQSRLEIAALRPPWMSLVAETDGRVVGLQALRKETDMDSCHVARTIASKPGPATAELRHEHEVILRALAVLERAGARLELGRTVDEAALQELVALIRMFADRCHHGKEEDQLFPLLRAKGVGDSLAPFLEDHEKGRGYLATLASGAPRATRAAAARRYVGLLRDHIEREDQVLFPMAEEVLAPEDQTRLAAAYAEVEARVVGPGVHERLLGDLERLERALPEAE